MCGSQVGDCFVDGYVFGSWGVQQCQWGMFVYCYGFVGVDVEVGGGDGVVGYWYLLGFDYLVVGYQFGDGVVVDGDQEVFVGYGGMVQDVFDVFLQFQFGGVEIVVQFGFVGNCVVYVWCFVEQDFQWYVYWFVVEMVVGDGQLVLFDGFVDYCEWVVFVFVDGFEGFEVGGVY